MQSDITVKSIADNASMARFLRANRTFTGAGLARELIESFGFRIASFIEVGRRGTVPTWSAYDLGEAVLVLVDGIWTPQQAAALLASASLPPARLPTPNVNASAGSDAFSIWERVSTIFSGRGKRIVWCGYSYGGVLAEIAAVLSDLPQAWSAVECMTCGSFRPGDSRFAASLAKLSVVRWMNDSDPVPRFPPHLSEAPASIVAAGPFTAAVWMQYVQPGGGLVLGPGGLPFVLDLPTARIPAADVDLLAWLSGVDAGKVAGHSLQLYSERLSALVGVLQTGGKSIPAGSAAETFFPATQQGFNAAVADAAALASISSAEVSQTMAYIPVTYRPRAVVITGSFYVSWMGQLVCQCPTKSNAKTTAKYLFKLLRVMQVDSITSINNFALAWQAFWGVAVSSSAGFEPPFQTSP